MSGKTRKKSKIWVIVIILVVIAAMAFMAWQFLMAGRQGNLLANIRSTKASTGTIEKTVTGTGNLSAEDTTEDITVLDGLTLDEVLVDAGDQVQAGDALATFDAPALQLAIWNTQAELDGLDVQLNLLKGKTETQFVRAAVAGRIKQILTTEGESVQAAMSRSGALLVLSLDGKMRVAFTPAQGSSLTVGDKVTVSLSDGSTAEGTVRSISPALCVVTISDKTAPVGDEVAVSLDGASLGSGTLMINEPLAVTATDGTINSVYYELNDNVSSGSKLFKLETAPVSRDYQKLYVQRQDKAERLATLIGYAQSNALLAVSAGEVLAVNITDGQTTGGSVSAVGNSAVSAGNAAVVLRTGSDTQLTINIDELDIAALSVGQTAKVTFDALPALTLDGAIIEIAESGMIGQGSTTFTVTMDLPEDASLRLGMTATAVITVDKREGVVRIPLEALQESGNEQFVYIGTAVSPDNLGEKRLLTTGISDGEYVEVKTGLADGETVNYYFATSSSTMFPFQRGGTTSGTSATQD